MKSAWLCIVNCSGGIDYGFKTESYYVSQDRKYITLRYREEKTAK